MLPRRGELGSRVVASPGREENVPGRDPPLPVGLMDVAAVAFEHRDCAFGAVDRGEEARRQCELVAFERERQRFELAERERPRELICAKERSDLFDQPLLYGAWCRVLFIGDEGRGGASARELVQRETLT